MEYIIAVLILVIVVGAVDRNRKHNSSYKPKGYSPKETNWVSETIQGQKEQYDYKNGYKSKWMFSYNEKAAFNKIKEITDGMGLYLFAKVRLFDLVEPKEQVENKTAYQWKIQAKHVDFVICDQKLVARLIIEYDDSSHDTKIREERDNFVDAILLNCGYKVLHIRSVEPDSLKAQLEAVFKLSLAD